MAASSWCGDGFVARHTSSHFIHSRFSEAIKPLCAEIMLRTKLVQRAIAEGSLQSRGRLFRSIGARCRILRDSAYIVERQYIYHGFLTFQEFNGKHRVAMKSQQS